MKAGLVFDDATRCNTDSDPRRPFTKVAPPIANEWGVARQAIPDPKPGWAPVRFATYRNIHQPGLTAGK